MTFHTTQTGLPQFANTAFEKGWKQFRSEQTYTAVCVCVAREGDSRVGGGGGGHGDSVYVEHHFDIIHLR